MSVHLIKGADDVLRADAANRLVDELVGDGDRGLILSEFAGADYELAEAADAAATLPFLTDRRVILIRHLARFSSAEDLSPVLTCLADPLETSDLVLVWERSPEPGSRLAKVPPSLSKAVKSAGGEVTDSAPPAKKRDAWVVEQFAAHGLSIDRPAAGRVAEQVGETAGAVIELIERVRGLVGDAGTVGTDDVEGLLGEAGGVPPWDLTDAIDAGHPADAIDNLHRMLRGGDRHPLQVMATLHTHFSRILRLEGADVAGERQAAELLGMGRSTFPAKKALGQARALGHRGATRAIDLLAQADLDLRGAQAWGDELVMEVLVARLAALPRR